jgi:hypothetical protein
MKKIVINENGLFWQSQYPVSIPQIKHRRTKLQRLVEDTKLEQRQLAEKLSYYERELASLKTPEIDKIIERIEREKAEALQRATDFLKECVGNTNFEELQQKGVLKFRAKDNMLYQIKRSGTIYRRDERQWKRLCLIRPQMLPLPDFVLAALINVREHPEKYVLRRR